MPVRSRSRPSISTRIVFESRAMARSSSSSASTPGLMAPPSRRLSGGVSASVASSSAARSDGSRRSPPRPAPDALALEREPDRASAGPSQRQVAAWRAPSRGVETALEVGTRWSLAASPRAGPPAAKHAVFAGALRGARDRWWARGGARAARPHRGLRPVQERQERVVGTRRRSEHLEIPERDLVHHERCPFAKRSEIAKLRKVRFLERLEIREERAGRPHSLSRSVEAECVETQHLEAALELGLTRSGIEARGLPSRRRRGAKAERRERRHAPGRSCPRLRPRPCGGTLGHENLARRELDRDRFEIARGHLPHAELARGHLGRRPRLAPRPGGAPRRCSPACRGVRARHRARVTTSITCRSTSPSPGRGLHLLGDGDRVSVLHQLLEIALDGVVRDARERRGSRFLSRDVRAMPRTREAMRASSPKVS